MVLFEETALSTLLVDNAVDFSCFLRCECPAIGLLLGLDKK